MGIESNWEPVVRFFIKIKRVLSLGKMLVCIDVRGKKFMNSADEIKKRWGRQVGILRK